MTGESVVIGLGNDFRRDDGVGLRVAHDVEARGRPGVRVVGVSEPAELLDIWRAAPLAIVVDAATGPAASVGRIRRWEAPGLETTIALSSHGLGLAQTFALGRALDRVPDRLVLFTVDVTDTTLGTGLTPQVAAAASRLVDLIVAEFTQTDGLTPSRREPARSSRAGRQPTGEETWRPAQSNRLPR